MARALWLLVAAGCGSGPAQDGLSARQRAHAAQIRDTAAAMGLSNGALLGGIAMSETNLAHCWDEARYACMGPASPSCDGGPVIAGSADGPCAAMQGGLGMFQLDAGTWSETLARYGNAILSEPGNTAEAVRFVIAQVERDVAEAASQDAAIQWLDQVPLVAGEARTEQWARIMACRYNGCCADSALCRQRAEGYRDHAIDLHDELGDAFWATPAAP
ncbi:MAG TPA: hypothetical protein VGC42_02010 [Kofleriaceae bacterium]